MSSSYEWIAEADLKPARVGVSGDGAGNTAPHDHNLVIGSDEMQRNGRPYRAQSNDGDTIKRFLL
jgi:hypothetical protein